MAHVIGIGLPVHPVAITALVLVAALPLAPIASLLQIALQGDAEIWRHLAAYVLPTALRETVLLLAGVSAIAAIVGVGAAWIVTSYQFPGRDLLVWLLPLPLAFPTYIVAYVCVDALDALGPVQRLLRSLTGWRSPADYWFPEVR